MSLPLSGQISLRDIYYEIYGSYPTSNDNVSLEVLVQASNLADKTAPYQLSDFYGYSHGPTLEASPNPWEPDYQAQGGIIAVMTDAENSWNASVILGGSWLSITKGGSGTGEGDIWVYVTQNGPEPRNGKIQITSDAPTYVVNVNQGGMP